MPQFFLASAAAAPVVCMLFQAIIAAFCQILCFEFLVGRTCRTVAQTHAGTGPAASESILGLDGGELV